MSGWRGNHEQNERRAGPRVMNARKDIRARIFGDTQLTGAIRDQVSLDEHAGEGDLRVLSIDKLNRNPNNPRHLPISIEQINALRRDAAMALGIALVLPISPEILAAIGEEIEKISDDLAKQQIEGIYLLAKSVSQRGLMQPISVYSDAAGQYFILAGERRFLAHVLLGRTTIRAMVKESAGDEIDRRIGSLIENIVREDLTTSEKIDFIEGLVHLHEQQKGSLMTAEALHEMIHESVRTCRRYLRYISAPTSVRASIRSGEISSIRDIDAALQEAGDSEEIDATDTKKNQNALASVIKRGRQRQAVSLGRTSNIPAVRSLIKAWLGPAKMKAEFGRVNWDDLESVQIAWTNFLAKVEEQERMKDEPDA